MRRIFRSPRHADRSNSARIPALFGGSPPAAPGMLRGVVLPLAAPPPMPMFRSFRSPSPRARIAALALRAGVVLAWSAGAAVAAEGHPVARAPVAADAVPDTTGHGVEAWLAEQARRLAPDARIEVTLGRFAPPPGAPACERAEPSLSGHARAWGTTTVVLRCVAGARWTLAVPARVRVFATGWVAARPLQNGETLDAQALAPADIELSAHAPGTLADPESATGQVATRALAAGKPVRKAELRAPRVVTQGDPVQLTVGGAGFSIAAEARALGHAGEGEMVRVQTPNGRVLSGTARAGRRVEVAL